MSFNHLKIMLIGDSITHGFKIGSLLPELNINNKGVSGDSTIETVGRISAEWFTIKPDLVFICIGTNDIARGRNDSFIIENVGKIIEKIKLNSPESDIIITSLFPTRNNPERSNETIDRLNFKLRYYLFHNY